MQGMKFSVAVDNQGALGLILNDIREPSDQKTETHPVYVGIHLTSEHAPAGSRWECRRPVIIASLNELPRLAKLFSNLHH